MTVKVICPGCKTEHEADDSSVGAWATCSCGQDFTVVLPDEYRNRFVFDCPQCGSALKSDLHCCGDLDTCPGCKRQIQIPDSPDKTYFDTRVDFTPGKDDFCFHEADYAISRKILRVTNLTSRQISEQWTTLERQQYFFSCGVTDPIVLARIRDRVIAVVKGQMTKAQAHNLIRRYFAGEGADALAELGFAPPREATGMAQLASVNRVQLILDTNVKMAQEVGQYKQWAAQRDIYKYGIWKCGYAKEHRQEHLARDGKAYAFDHPIWTQSPPGGEFGCHCYRMLVREEDLEERGLKPEPLDSPFRPSSLGFDPSVEF